MPNYYRMNKILEEEGTCERARKEEEDFGEHLAFEGCEKASDEAMKLEQEDEK